MSETLSEPIRQGQRVFVSYGCDDLVLAGRVVTVNAAPDEDGMVDVKLFYRTRVSADLLTVISQPLPMPEPEELEER